MFFKLLMLFVAVPLLELFLLLMISRYLLDPLMTFAIVILTGICGAWLAQRWEDPAFPVSFPWFNTTRYWGEHILELREQIGALNEPPLQLM